MASGLSEYKEMVDGLTKGGFTDPQTQALVEFLERVVSGLRDEMRDGFRAVHERLDRMDERLDRMDGRLNRMDDRLDRTDDRFDKLYDRIDSLKNWLIGGLSALIVTLISAIVALAVSL